MYFCVKVLSFLYMEENRCYIYRHRRLDTNEIFYVGKGSYDLRYLGVTESKTNDKRANDSVTRSKWWHKIVNKGGYQVEIIAENLLEEGANELECFLIETYGRRDLGKGTLCNLTDGGEGVLGLVVSEEERKKKSDSMKKVILTLT